jgi:drug/metabolite transporter (DMT)-like permease
LRGVSEKRHNNNTAIAGSLLFVVFLWGGNNVGTKWLVADWPPIITGSTRFLVAGLLLLAILRFTPLLGEFKPLPAGMWRQLWFRGGFGLAAYIVPFCIALHLTAASHVALYVGASPIWALLAEERPRLSLASFRRYAAALLALAGVIVLFWPSLKTGSSSLAGECAGMLASLAWAFYNWQARFLSQRIPGVEVAAHSMWMAGVWLLPYGLWEIYRHSLVVDARHCGVQALCILFGGVVPYALWNSALRHWRASEVMLFNNFIPLTTASWAYCLLKEPLTPTFCAAMGLIVAGVLIGQVDWAKIFRLPEGF